MMTIEEAAASAAARDLSRHRNTPHPTEEDRARAARGGSLMSRLGWKKVSAAERSRRGRQHAAMGAGRPRAKERCYCGERNWHSAVIRRFDCCKRAGRYPAGVPMPPAPPRKKKGQPA